MDMVAVELSRPQFALTAMVQSETLAAPIRICGGFALAKDRHKG
jgi:hypothetical protein